ncbi:MAG: AbrB/MazE/SpoVT family DNA-binding domain-containing protein [Desulfohalobiaceae bacterium]|nr:AbrB/MazE/SpoVT family DNA-binding domain-containing protein [Desulfohalobiaceae bacterium]
MAIGDYSHNYRPKKLRELIKQGKTAKEIMRELSISSWSLREHLLLLQKQDGKYYEVEGLYSDDWRQQPHQIQEGIIFSPRMLEKSGFKPGDSFEMIVEKDRIILKKI